MIILAVIIIIILAIVLYLISGYNGLVNARNRVKNSYSQIDVQLKRRNDLIPNLVETVKGYAGHEKDVFENVTKARSGLMNAGSVKEVSEANNALTGALTSLFAIAENYPELKADQNFKELQSELTETEDKISYSRQFYNDAVLMYNNKCEQFPSNIIAGIPVWIFDQCHTFIFCGKARKLLFPISHYYINLINSIFMQHLDSYVASCHSISCRNLRILFEFALQIHLYQPTYYGYSYK